MVDDRSQQDNDASIRSEVLVASFDARLKRLEEPEERSNFDGMQKRASFVALVIGIFLSIISLYDAFLSKPREALFRNLEEFNRSVNAVANLRQSMIQIQFQSDNPQMIFAMNSMVAPQILANIQYATALLPQLDDHVGIPQLMVLISEAMNIYDWKSARQLVDRAVAMKNAPPSMQSEALRYKARLMFFTGKIPEGRKAYDEALNALSAVPSFGINGARAYIVADWTVAEFSFGDCSSGNEQIKHFVRLAQDRQVPASVRLGLISTLKNQLDQLSLKNRGCFIANEFQSIN